VPSLRRNRSPFAAGGSIPSASHHAGVAGRSSLGAPLRRRGFDYRHPRQFARKANLVKAPRRNRGEVGSKPTPSTIWDDSSTGRAAASQAEDAGSSPARSTSLRALRALWLGKPARGAKAAVPEPAGRRRAKQPIAIGARTRVQTCLASKSGGERYPGAPPIIPLRRARCTRLPVKQS
jgi:hypothetical protein